MPEEESLVEAHLVPEEVRLVWNVVAARQVGGAKGSLLDEFRKALSEYAVARVALESGTEWQEARGTRRWSAKQGGDGTLDVKLESGERRNSS